MSNMFDMMKKAQAMQAGLQKAQTELANATLEGQAGNGLVTITLTGTHEMKAIQIKPAAIDASDPSLLEDLVKAAYTDALKKANALTKSKMSAVTGGLSIPGIL
jgi:DNA-binding YbaB/EbfC family protein